MLSRWKLKRKIARENTKSKTAQHEILSQLPLLSADITVLKNYRRSDTLFILGSGSSICSLNSSHWQYVASKDSLGINHWLIHPHVPNYYTFEVPRNEDHQQIMLANLAVRKNAYQKTACLFKGGSDFNPQFAGELKSVTGRQDLPVYVPTFFTVGEEQQFTYLLRNYDSISNKLRKKHPDALFRKRASIVFATMLAYDLGFKHIVYCGVDGVAGSGYFYESQQTEHIYGKAKIPATTGQIQGSVHKTMDPELNPLTAEKCLQLIDVHLFKSKDIQMWVGTPNSILSSWLPTWQWPL